MMNNDEQWLTKTLVREFISGPFSTAQFQRITWEVQYATTKIRVLTDQDFMVHVRKNELCWDEQRWSTRLTLVGCFVYNSGEARLFFLAPTWVNNPIWLRILRAGARKKHIQQLLASFFNTIHVNYIILNENFVIHMWSTCIPMFFFCFNYSEMTSWQNKVVVEREFSNKNNWGKSLCKQMGVSKNRGTQKWMIYNGKAYFLMDDLEGKPTIFDGNIQMRFLLFKELLVVLRDSLAA